MRLYLRSADRRPDPPPLRTNDRAVVRAGMVAWAVLLVAALVMRARLVEQGRGWWVWTPVAAIALGFYGLYYVRQRERRQSGEVPAQDCGTSPTERARQPRQHERPRA